MSDTRHVHDWRVDPSQVIITIGDQARVRLGCAVPGCDTEADAYSRPARAVNRERKDTWRVWTPRRGDEIKTLA